ncbi:MAG: hypothetical protein GXP01_09400, partial [Alphaproteobacteria bacterium]|nr:hypothetical protein [Alphaproteobacteria bacterium]
MDYLRDPDEIYRLSFLRIEVEADLSRFDEGERAVAIRLIHATAMPAIADDLIFSNGAVAAGRAALAGGAPLICDANMVRHGIIARYLPAGNEVLCNLGAPEVVPLAKTLGTTRTAAALETLKPHMKGAIIVIGNAPTALYHLLEGLDLGWPEPALILGF